MSSASNSGFFALFIQKWSPWATEYGYFLQGFRAASKVQPKLLGYTLLYFVFSGVLAGLLKSLFAWVFHLLPAVDVPSISVLASGIAFGLLFCCLYMGEPTGLGRFMGPIKPAALEAMLNAFPPARHASFKKVIENLPHPVSSSNQLMYEKQSYLWFWAHAFWFFCLNHILMEGFFGFFRFTFKTLLRQLRALKHQLVRGLQNLKQARPALLRPHVWPQEQLLTVWITSEKNAEKMRLEQLAVNNNQLPPAPVRKI